MSSSISSRVKTPLFVLIVSALVLLAGHAPAVARTHEEALAARTAKVRDAIARLGIGEEASVRVKLLDKSLLIGFIAEVEEDRFVLASPETELRRTIEYDEIEQLHGQNSATAVRVSVGESKNPLKNVVQLARLRISGASRPTEQKSGNQYLSKPAVIVLVVLAVGLVLIGVELGKS